ncbi:hypothetical protein ElyMa_000701100 [Elysia marginata]|uniref:Uncharacterized protein n=1 Tax=Elysia marginata TaxID=1093978 RepID=A0AAV4GIT0_9GAST|nr:hypothetical protein ElyMa_000701100 [Elysia marginata]
MQSGGITVVETAVRLRGWGGSGRKAEKQVKGWEREKGRETVVVVVVAAVVVAVVLVVVAVVVAFVKGVGGREVPVEVIVVAVAVDVAGYLF